MLEADKFAHIKLSKENQIILAHLCEDCKVEPSIVINRLITTVVLCAIGSSDLCVKNLDSINQAYTESISELIELKNQIEIDALKRFIQEIPHIVSNEVEG